MQSGDRNETTTGVANNARIIQLADLRRGDISQATDMALERASDDDMSNEDDDDEEDLDAPATISRTRENSNTSFSARERTISEQSRRRQENATGLDESLDEHEGEDAYGSDHDDIDDDDDDDDDGEGEVHGGSDVNQLDLIWIQRFLAFLSNTNTQLSACFSTIVKLIDELFLQLFFYENWKQQGNKSKGVTNILDLDPKIFGVFKDAFDECLDPTWNWFS
uniref:Uncharacterized protein n=1 Tax=Meloidogyne incognita TaxID=6306 RepID=A0A914L2J6_MELIC